MARILVRPPVRSLLIAAGNLPDSGSGFYWSDAGGTGGTDPAAALGEQLDGKHIDEVYLHLVVSAWDALVGVEVAFQRKRTPASTGTDWSFVEPLGIAPEAAGPHLDVTNGKLVVKATLGTTFGVAIGPIPMPGAARLRYGLRANDAGVHGLFACTGFVEYIGTDVYR
jgi:hypothetical protein